MRPVDPLVNWRNETQAIIKIAHLFSNKQFYAVFGSFFFSYLFAPTLFVVSDNVLHFVDSIVNIKEKNLHRTQQF